MRILLTNDDGIHAEGLAVLERIARTISDDIWTVAPEGDQSGLSHSLTLSSPLRLREVSERKFALSGTPTDCVIMAVRRVMPEPPDLVLSGVNAGQNICDDVTYSGTVAGAMEGMMLGIRSIALSQSYDSRANRHVFWETAERHAPGIIDRLISSEFRKGTLVNVNFPAVAPEAVEGVDVTRQGKLEYSIGIEERQDGRGFPYFWLKFGRHAGGEVENSDFASLTRNRISVTPLKLDLTEYALMDDLRALFS
ncbi:5'/3'-nucleotidase SurE [Consotaella salsifontis]|uniref:5'-nucleotidase SurE n=1 Tax=Consotaella salsifontis TaxID=1365950 RepID=A0A1T4R468_9HYPH|nr:5'/3'-nucleotidase SurE [Consotaella salsifontis]SKA10830.1 5'-nucleotidase /3'-nucleotidase /exopolyphosphatase [Consotaella salsifontis]